MKELVSIPSSEQTTAMKASTLRELIKQLNIPAEKFAEAVLNPPTVEEQKEAALNLSTELNKVSQLAQEESKVSSVEIEPITLINQVSQELSQATDNQTAEKTIQPDEPEIPTNPTNKNDDSNGNIVEESLEDREQALTTLSQIQQFVIPVIVDRINTYGKPDKDTQSIVYKSEEYTASVRLEKDLQILSLDRNSPELADNQEALLASKNDNSEEYSIIINNLTKEEFERFQALFEEQQARREQNQQQTQTKQSDHELG
ncbi:MAG: hypothetical protein C6Y22_30310 [Hapalosiphonaceae cyanobacterium JJU2]|nr:MAG: hypothetical protein C6Y22_30310 [Hapalosiphonaceae cyanobacterium JJU2]